MNDSDLYCLSEAVNFLVIVTERGKADKRALDMAYLALNFAIQAMVAAQTEQEAA